MNFTIYGDDSKGLIRLDPRTKLLIFFSSMFLSIHSYNLITLIVFGTILCGTLALCGKPWLALKFYIVFGLACYLRHIIMSSGTGAFAPMIILSSVITIILFTFPVIISFVLLSQTTRISHFLSAFQAMHLPPQAVIPFAVLFRFIPAVQEEWTGIRKAMAFRGIELNPMSIIRSPIKAIEYILIPLLFSSVAIMEELAAAALARGMDAESKRTSYEEVKMGTVDYIVLTIFIGLIVMVVVTGKVGVTN